MDYFSRLYVTLILFFLPVLSPAVLAWDIVTHTDVDNNTQVQVAHQENNNGYSLEIYRDGNGAVRSRFTMNNDLINLANRQCPTFQVDDREISNRSVNDAKCISSNQWAEFILGYVIDDQIKSSQLHNMMNGNNIIYRYQLENEGYGEAIFSLNGSKRVLSTIIGNNVVVRTDSGFSADE